MGPAARKPLQAPGYDLRGVCSTSSHGKHSPPKAGHEELANRLAKLEQENAQLKKAVLGSRSEKSKMPRIKTGSLATPEEQEKTHRERRAAKAQTPTVRVEHKVPPPSADAV